MPALPDGGWLLDCGEIDRATTGIEARLLSQGERWPTSSHPRDCCRILDDCDHGPEVPEDLAGAEDAKAVAALRKRAMAPLRF